MTAYLQQSVTIPYNMPNIMQHTRIGYLTPTADTSAITTAASAYAGHVFGRLGQGEKTMPGNQKPFYWGAIVGTYIPGMMISFFPETEEN